MQLRQLSYFWLCTGMDEDLPNRNSELRPVRGVALKIGLGVAWNKEDPAAARDDNIGIARSLVRPGR